MQANILKIKEDIVDRMSKISVALQKIKNDRCVFPYQRKEKKWILVCGLKNKNLEKQIFFIVTNKMLTSFVCN